MRGCFTLRRVGAWRYGSHMVMRLDPGEEGERSYGRQGDGRYVVQVRIRFSKTAAPVKVRGTSSLKSDRAARKQAEERLEAAIVKKRREHALDTGVQAYDPVRSLYDLWHERASSAPEDFGLRPSTVEEYENAWRGHLDAEIGNLAIDEVGTQTLARALRSVSFRRRKLRGGVLSEKPEYHAGTARTCYATLAQVFGYGVEMAVIDRSPVVGQIVPSMKAQPRAKLRVDASMMHRLRDLFDAHEERIRVEYPHITPIPLRAISEVLLYASARIGEVLALETTDLDPDGLIQDDDDLEAHGIEVYIRATQKRGGGVRDEKAGRRTGSVLYRQPLPKGGEDGSRIKTIPGWVHDRFIAPRIEGPRQRPAVYIFRTASGAQIEKQNVNRAWQGALKDTEFIDRETGLVLVTPHDLRKAAAQVLADAIGMEAAQAALAHRSVRTTEGTYAVRPVQRVDFAKELDAVLRERADSSDVF